MLDQRGGRTITGSVTGSAAQPPAGANGPDEQAPPDQGKQERTMTALAGPRPENPAGQARADVLTAEEFAARVQIRRVHTVTDLCAAGVVPGASKIGHEWRVHWPTFYAAVAGPGVPDGEVVTSRQLARYLRVDERVVRRAAAAPGTPGRLPGFQLGKTWLHAMRAVNAMAGWSQPGGQDAAGPGTALE